MALTANTSRRQVPPLRRASGRDDRTASPLDAPCYCYLLPCYSLLAPRYHRSRTLPDTALDGIRIVDLSQGIAGPYCTKLLADLGAEVVKVEPPAGDLTRRLGPFPGDVPDPDKSGLFIHLNGGKKSITLDLATESGRIVLRKLLAGADVLVESETPGRMAELGLAYDDLQGRLPEARLLLRDPVRPDRPVREATRRTPSP